MRIDVAAVLGFSLLVGCSATTSSRNIRTAGVVAKIDVTSERAGQSVVETDLVIGGSSSNTYMVLEGGDRLYATHGDDKREMNAISDGEYEAKFPVDQGEFTVSLVRDQDDPAPKSQGTLPPPFEITSELGDTPISRKKDSVKLTWAPGHSGADVTVELDGECIHRMSIDVGGDPGELKIKKGKIRAWKSKAKEACDVNVVITLTTKGTTDPAFDSDSRFQLHQVRQTRFVSGP